MVTRDEVTNAIVILGHKPDQEGRIQPIARDRALLGGRLYRRGVAPVVIPSGWYWPKDKNLRKYNEAEIIERFLHEIYGDDVVTMCERDSTSVPENLSFIREEFPGLDEAVIVTGDLFRDRTEFFADKIFAGRVQLRYAVCKDDISDADNQRRLLAYAKCILKDMKPGDLKFLGLHKSGGRLRSRWDQLNKKHKKTCPLHRTT